ncbi:hypothetical protein OIU76_005220 [Salix suchowensis]|uniref:Uncharacterized protein n=1 Tax=Salix suchowensis TaxID=1278906 RepID=A0ABQ9AA23_9ROSI|nr:hypothetical protein OIU78_015083 [Salix suchowensis]KAJ6329364.1 hypothetical protein OIU77_010945 [Salix suchowensis]KAJ6343438.1 hypothetical protein OIU76_005220 [Salix suchowensis]
MYQQQQQPPSSSSSPQKSNLPSGLTRFWINFTLAPSTALLRGLILNHLRADLQGQLFQLRSESTQKWRRGAAEVERFE